MYAGRLIKGLGVIPRIPVLDEMIARALLKARTKVLCRKYPAPGSRRPLARVALALARKAERSKRKPRGLRKG